MHIFKMPTILCFRHGRTVGAQAVSAVGTHGERSTHCARRDRECVSCGSFRTQTVEHTDKRFTLSTCRTHSRFRHPKTHEPYQLIIVEISLFLLFFILTLYFDCYNQSQIG